MAKSQTDAAQGDLATRGTATKEKSMRSPRALPAEVDGSPLKTWGADQLFNSLKSKREELATLDEKKKNLPLEITAIKKEIDRRKGA